jgi:Protein of unknown function (DUF1428)
MTYTDLFVVPVPTKNIEPYRKLAGQLIQSNMDDHGAAAGVSRSNSQLLVKLRSGSASDPGIYRTSRARSIWPVLTSATTRTRSAIANRGFWRSAFSTQVMASC